MNSLLDNVQPRPNILLKGKIFDLSTPLIMAIINVTPDSFFAESRVDGQTALLNSVERALADGASIIDLGGYSTRPGAEFVSDEEENRRIATALEAIRKHFPDAIVSLDTFRSSVAAMAVESYDADIVNDISGGTLDREMLPTVARLNRPYILMHMRGTPQTMQQMTQYDDIISDMLSYFAEKTQQLRGLGFTSDIILDPGFGFAKTTEQNYTVLQKMRTFDHLNMPILAGVSRKSMICRVLDCGPAEALNGTTVLNTMALMNGASILRVHDVKPAVEAVELYKALAKG